MKTVAGPASPIGWNHDELTEDTCRVREKSCVVITEGGETASLVIITSLHAAAGPPSSRVERQLAAAIKIQHTANHINGDLQLEWSGTVGLCGSRGS